MLAQLVTEMSNLVQREIDLARTEMNQKIAQAGKGVRLIAVGSALVHAGLLAIIATAVVALVQYAALPWWMATLAVGAFVFIVGLMLVAGGRRILRIQHLAPQKTLQTLKDDAEWATKRATT
jgi:predicted phage tail protein